jgi:hypothetical protein
MPAHEPENSCVITWNPGELTLDGLAKFISLLVDLHSEVAVPYVTEELYQGSNVVELEPLRIASVHMGSPLATELLSGRNPIDIVALGMVGYMLRHPERLGEFLSKVRTGRYRAERERIIERAKLLETRGRIEARGRPISRFEGRYRNKERESHSRAGREGRISDRTHREGRDRGGPGGRSRLPM